MKTVREIVGKNLALLREERGLRQQDLSDDMGAFGFSWSRARVAEVETGKRPISFEALLAVAFALSDRGEVVGLADLFAGDGWAEISDSVRISQAGIRRAVDGGPVELDLRPELGRAIANQMRAMEPGLRTAIENLGLPSGTTSKEFKTAVRWGRSESARRIAKQLGITVQALHVVAHRLWARPLEDERDARVSEHDFADAGSMRAARGQATRRLTGEVREYLGEGGSDS